MSTFSKNVLTPLTIQRDKQVDSLPIAPSGMRVNNKFGSAVIYLTDKDGDMLLLCGRRQRQHQRWRDTFFYVQNIP